MQKNHKAYTLLHLFFFGTVLSMLAAATISPAAEKITILYSNDIRGELEPCG